MTCFSSLAAVEARLAALPGPDGAAIAAARARQQSLTKPPGSLGRLEDLALFMAGWQGRARPRIGRAQALVFAGNHGICAQGVNPYPQAVTAQMVANFRAGGAAINQLARLAGADLAVVALDLERPTADFTAGPAMTEAEVLAAMGQGAAAVDPAADVVILGEMGIGNSTVAAALAAALFGGGAEPWVGPGTGSDAAGLARKAAAVERGLARHAGARGLGLLMAFGGREQAAICGAVLAARERRIPVILDGFICTAAAAVLEGAARPASPGPTRAAVDPGPAGAAAEGRSVPGGAAPDLSAPGPLAHCLAGHAGAEPGHARLLAALGRKGLLDLGLRLGEGTGAALALMILRAALACHDGMATFAEAGVADG